MIIPLSFIVSLLFTITYATDFDYKIDLARCIVDTTCFVKKSCLNPNTGETDAANEKVLEMLISLDTLKVADTCDVIIQIKVLDESKYLVFMQITADTADLDEAKGIAIKHADAEQIACKKVNEDIVHTLSPVPDKNNFFEFVGTKSSVFEPTKLFCSLFLTSKEEVAVSSYFKVTRTLKNFDKNPSLVYTQNGLEKVIEFQEKGDKFWDYPDKYSKCKPEYVKSIEETNENYVLKEVDLTLPSIKCSEGKLMLKKDDGTESFGAEEYTCEKKNAGYAWSPSLDTSGTVACVIKAFCSACGDTPSSPEDCPQDTCTAPTINKDSTTDCQTLTCPSTENEFTFDGKSSAKSDGSIICKKSATDPTKGGWFFKGHENDTPTEYSKIACAVIKDCEHKQFDFTCPSDMKCEENKPEFDAAKFNFTCQQGYLQKADGKGVALATVCDRKTGEWQGLKDNDNIVCAHEKKEESSEKNEGETKAAGPGMYIGIVGGILVGAGAIVAYYFLIHKKKQDAKKTTKKEEGTSKKSSKKVESKSGGVGSSNEAKKEEKKSDPNKESEKPAAEAAKDAPKDGKETPKDGVEPPKETPKDAAATPAAAAATPTAPPTPGAAATSTPATPAADSAPAPADATPV